MPKYLAIDFLAQALRQKELLLSHMLLSYPESDEIEPIFQLHESYNKNEKQTNCFRDAGETEGLIRYEKLSGNPVKLTSILFGNKPERFETCHGIDVGLKFASDSPVLSNISDSFSEFQDEVVQYVCNYLDQKERSDPIFLIESIEWRHLNDGQELEEVAVLADCFEQFLTRIPHFHDLTARLKPTRVTDPFLDKNGQPRAERQIIRFGEESKVKQATLNPYKENFQKDLTLQTFEKINENEMEELSSLFMDTPYNLSVSCFSTLNDLELENDEKQFNDPVYDLKRTFKYQNKSENERYKIVKTDASAKTEVKSFIQLNEAGRKDKVSKPVHLLLLQSPPPDDIWSKITASQNLHENDNRIKKNIHSFQPLDHDAEKSLSLCSPGSQYKIARKIETTNKLLDKISSLILEVPDLKAKFQNLDTTTVCHALSSLTAKMEEFASELELKLRWDPMPRSPLPNVPNIQILNGNIPKDKHTDQSFCTSTGSALPWKDVYAYSEGIPPKSIDEKERKPSPAVLVTTNPERKASPAFCLEKNNKNSMSSGIDDFVLLRTGAKSLKPTTKSNPPKAIVKPAIAVEEERPIKARNNHTVTQLYFYHVFSYSQHEAPNMEDHTVKVPLCKDYQNVLSIIKKHMRPFIVQFQEAGCISSSYTMENLTADYTRFILKQEEKRNTDGKLLENGHQGNKKFRMLVCLHAMVNATELLTECGLSTAKDYIVETVRAQYQQCLGDGLDNVVVDLTNAEQRLFNMEVNHPKITKTCQLIQEYLSESMFSLHHKVLVLVFRGFREISLALLKKLERITGLETLVLDKTVDVFAAIKERHVIIVDVVNVSGQFPWSSFTSIVLYEDRYDWLQKIFHKSPTIQHVICLKGDANLNQPTQDDFNIKASVESEKPKRHTYTLIGSAKITRNVDLLMCLEQKNDIIIVEREYDKIERRELSSSSKMCLQPDLLLDEKAAVLIKNVTDFANEEGYKKAVDLVLSTSFKCQMCNIILSCEANGGSAYSLFKDVQLNLAKFHSCLVSIQSSFPQFVIDVFYSHSVQQTATLIRELCEITKDSSNEFSKENWIKRDWFTDEITEHEAFLLRFPPLNSFSAQLMLNKLPLDVLLTTPFTSLRNTLPSIPDKTLMDFKRMTDCGSIIDNDYDHVDFRDDEAEFSRSVEDQPATSDCLHENLPCQVTPLPSSDKEHFKFSEYGSCNSSQHFPRVTPLYSSHTDEDSGMFAGSSITRQMTKKDWKIATENVEFQNNRDRFSTTDFEENEHGINHDSNFQFQPELLVPPAPLTNPHKALDSCVSLRNFNGNSRSTECDNRGKLKTIRRYSRPSGNASEVRDVGVVQPNPRKAEKLKRDKTVCSQFSQLHRTSFNKMPQHSQISHSNKGWQESELGFHEKPVKKRRLTFEIVPGAKNGQTRLTFV